MDIHISQNTHFATVNKYTSKHKQQQQKPIQAENVGDNRIRPRKAFLPRLVSQEKNNEAGMSCLQQGRLDLNR